MKISASYWMFEGGLEARKPITEAMQQAKELGFDAIELAIAGNSKLNGIESELFRLLHCFGYWLSGFKSAFEHPVTCTYLHIRTYSTIHICFENCFANFHNITVTLNKKPK